MSFRQFHNTASISRSIAKARILAIDEDADIKVYDWHKSDGTVGGSCISVQSDVLSDAQIESVIAATSSDADTTPTRGERIAALEGAVLTLSGV